MTNSVPPYRLALAGGWGDHNFVNFPADGYVLVVQKKPTVTFPERMAHGSLTHIFWDDATPFGEQGLFQEKLLLERSPDKPAKELVPLAKSWLNPAAGQSLAEGLRVEYDAAQRAYVLTRENGQGKQLTVRLNASPESPIVNPAFVVSNWGNDREARISIDGKKPTDTIDIRQGVVCRANGVTALVI
jgi:hypothetical protein